MLSELKDWIAAILGAGWTYSMGMWVDRPDIAASRVCSIQMNGGPAPELDARRPRFRVVLLGPVDGRADANNIVVAIESLMASATVVPPPCGAASIRAVAEPVGPAYTTENRPWCAVDFELFY